MFYLFFNSIINRLTNNFIIDYLLNHYFFLYKYENVFNFIIHLVNFHLNYIKITIRLLFFGQSFLMCIYIRTRLFILFVLFFYNMINFKFFFFIYDWSPIFFLYNWIWFCLLLRKIKYLEKCKIIKLL
jgi:hypothetical protein